MSTSSLDSELRRKLALMVITGPSKRHSAEDLVRAAVAGGATAVQIRWKDATTRQLIDVGKVAREITTAAGALLIVNDRVDVAIAIGADGAHLGDEDLPIGVARSVAGRGFILGRSVDNAAEAASAEAEGADYVGLGPIYPTGSKADVGPIVGLEGVRTVRGAIRIPIVGIGGIAETNAGAVIAAGADGVAVLSAVSADDDPRAAVERLLKRVRAVAT